MNCRRSRSPLASRSKGGEGFLVLLRTPHPSSRGSRHAAGSFRLGIVRTEGLTRWPLREEVLSPFHELEPHLLGDTLGRYVLPVRAPAGPKPSLLERPADEDGLRRSQSLTSPVLGRGRTEVHVDASPGAGHHRGDQAVSHYSPSHHPLRESGADISMPAGLGQAVRPLHDLPVRDRDPPNASVLVVHGGAPEDVLQILLSPHRHLELSLHEVGERTRQPVGQQMGSLPSRQPGEDGPHGRRIASKDLRLGGGLRDMDHRGPGARRISHDLDSELGYPLHRP